MRVKANTMPTPRWIEAKHYWQMDCRYKGTRRSFYSSLLSAKSGPAECRKQYAEWISHNGATSDIRFDEAWKEFLDHQYLNMKLTSYNKLKITGDYHLLRKFKHCKLSSIHKTEWQGIITQEYEKNDLAKNTLRGIASMVRVFCKYCSTKGYIPDSEVPMFFDIPVRASKKEKTILQPDELRMLFEPDDESWYIHAFRFIALTGLRRGEFCALQKKRDIIGNQLFVRESVSHEMIFTDCKTVNAQRDFIMIDLALQVISDFEQVCKQKGIKSEYLFCTPTGEMIHPRVIRNKWQEWREAHGINITLHELRHTYITYSRLRTNIKLEDLKSGYGHAKEMDTDGTYVHDIVLSLPEEQEKLEKDTAIASEINNAFTNILHSMPVKVTVQKKQKSL